MIVCSLSSSSPIKTYWLVDFLIVHVYKPYSVQKTPYIKAVGTVNPETPVPNWLNISYKRIYKIKNQT